jgi:4-hydroxybenzoate polyprenyltransferase
MRPRALAELVQLEHTLFALPFCASAVAFAARKGPLPAARIALAIGCFVAARTAAMAWNRYVDRDVDAENPRTSGRPIPRGAVSPRAALATTIVAAAAFLAGATLLGPLTALLAPVALVFVLGYSHMKRFTWASHLGLGVAVSGAPLGAGLALRGTVDPEVAWLAVGVATWVAGFDLIYALQDQRFDREHGLHSLPARFGTGAALVLSAVLHVGTIVALALAGLEARAGPVYAAALTTAALLLLLEHALVTPGDLSRIGKAFFTVNGWLSVLFFVGVLIDGRYAPIGGAP